MRYNQRFTIIELSILDDRNLNDKEKIFFVKLRNLADKNNRIEETNREICEQFNISQGTLSRHLKTLSENLYIKTEIVYKEHSKEVDKRIITILK